MSDVEDSNCSRNTKRDLIIKNLYNNKLILAPMVRCGSFTFRLLCLQNGCDTVYSEETVAQKFIASKRIENKILDTIDYVDSKTGQVFFRTNAYEKSRMVLQLGIPTPEIGLQAVQKVMKDVDAIDVNMGCPKKFSLQGAMGSALLSKPELAYNIIKTITDNVSIPVSVKIRLLPGDIQNTIKFILMLQDAGACAIAIHCRYVADHPKDSAHQQLFKYIYDCPDIHIPLIYNGDIFTYHDIQVFRNQFPGTSIMIGRGALINPSIFNEENKTIDSLIKEYLLISAKYINRFSNTKYCLWRMICINDQQKDNEDGERIQKSRQWSDWGDIFDIQKEFDALLVEYKEKERRINGNTNIDTIRDLDDLEKRDWCRRNQTNQIETEKQLEKQNDIETKDISDTINDLMTNENERKKIEEGEMIRKKIKMNNDN